MPVVLQPQPLPISRLQSGTEATGLRPFFPDDRPRHQGFRASL